jgi:hypothetical protein
MDGRHPAINYHREIKQEESSALTSGKTLHLSLYPVVKLPELNLTPFIQEVIKVTEG